MTIHSVIIQKLLSTNAHLGRRVAAHHFKIYTYGSRNAMTIIDSDKTLICLRNACQFIGSLVRQKGKFLFVNTNSLCDEIIDQMTSRIGCRNDSSWRLGGFLTNSGSPKKFRSRNKKLHLGSTQPPDCVVIMDTERKSSVIFEADKLQIPIVGLVDSSMPWDIYKRITYPVPANASVQFVYLFCNLITKTFLMEQKRFAAAIGGAVREEEVAMPQLSDAKSGTREESENSKQSTTSSMHDENFVIPYESLAVGSDDPLETKKLLDKLVVLKLNGSLGTKMGFNGPRSTIEVCNGLTYLDLIVNQIESLNFKHGCNVPLILMNTIRTHDGTLKVVEKYSKKNVDINTLCQSQSHLVTRGQDTESYHFDPCELFRSLKNSGTLDALILEGKEYILVVKYENLGALVDSNILNHLIQNRIQYCMEVTPKTSSDFRGTAFSSHEGKFQLSEITQMPAKHSLEKFKLFDTGNLWMNLKAVKKLVETDALNLENYPVSKKVNGDEILSQEIEILAIQSFDRAIGVNVPQSHFQPIMSTSDLLLVQSDMYTNAEGILTRNTARINPANPSIELGPEFEKLSDFQSRFKSIPSIIELDSLKVTGDVWFGTGITLKGKVTITAKPGIKLQIPDGLVLDNKEIADPMDI
ncbi:UTP--glucose-1-phosphate uridylyltransferase [Actinidia chinensis var. chinensis]|uniref:UTP--glucose-1-phosphate uridylyltransferase n=1 Tax=Actinidia chinensis var. chinensis TaxID=1590841 RepID=A0A2R6RAF2_ACTCC|nr:UTP--glucose-1-phosphate uridylyltransferase [Actinidia chinensis var. chinensis]